MGSLPRCVAVHSETQHSVFRLLHSSQRLVLPEASGQGLDSLPSRVAVHSTDGLRTSLSTSANPLRGTPVHRHPNGLRTSLLPRPILFRALQFTDDCIVLKLLCRPWFTSSGPSRPELSCKVHRHLNGLLTSLSTPAHPLRGPPGQKGLSCEVPRHPEWSSSSSLTSADSPLGLQAKRTSWQLLDDSRWPRTQCRLYNVLAGTRASCSPETPLQGTEPLRSALRSFSASRLNGCDLPCDFSARH